MPSLLSEDQIGERLKEFPDWKLEGKALARRYSFPSFKGAMDFVNRVAEEAERINHHPDITINYSRVTLYLWTHDSGGVTNRDFRLVSLIEDISAQAQRS